MIIYALQSDNDDFKGLISEIAEMAEVKLVHDAQALVLEMPEANAVLLDLDTDLKAMEKLIKSIRKADTTRAIIALCNNLEGKKLQKQQASRAAADIYLTYPMDQEVMKMMVEEAMNSLPKEVTGSFSITLSDDEDGQESEIISLTEQDSDMSEDNQDDFDLDLGGDGEINLSEDGEESEVIDLSSDSEIDLGGDDGDEFDLSLGEDDDASAAVEEVDNSLDLSLSDDDPAESGEDFSIGDDAADEDFSLSEDEGEGLDLSFSEEDSNDSDGSDEVGELSELNFGLTDELAAEGTGTKVEASDEPISLDDDVTMGGIDLSGMESSDDDPDFDKTRPILQSELSDILGDEDSEEQTSEAQLSSDVEDGDLADIEFGLGGDDVDEEDGATIIASQLPDDSEMFEEEEDDFQTKLREIDQMLKENTAVTQLAEVGLDEEDEVLEEGDDDIEEGLTVESSIDDLLGESQAAPAHQFSESLTQEHKDYISGHDGELVRLGETIKSLRLDREQLLKKVEDLEKNQGNQQDNLLTVQAQLDEKKIENSIMKKRYAQQIEDLNLKLELVSNKKAVLEEKNKQIEGEFQKLRKEKKLDVNRVRSRERELEDKLELLRKDAEVQVRNRDQKILELKRRIDALEFDIENAHLKERQSLSDQAVLEDKMTKVISTLRSAIGQFEEDNTAVERKKVKKKNLDV